MISRRESLRALLAAAAAVAARPADRLFAGLVKPVMEVRKDPGCGCCDLWADHMRAAGFTLEVTEDPNRRQWKARIGIPADFETCHTGVVEGYVVDGHVPADLVTKMLGEKPAFRGLAVPGMPVGSPGMEVGNRKDPYDVLAFTADGKRSVYAKR
jgi:hypothetical protein